MDLISVIPPPPQGNYNVEQKGTLQVLIKLLKTTDKLSKGLGVLKYCSLGWVGKSLQSYVGAAKVSTGALSCWEVVKVLEGGLGTYELGQRQLVTHPIAVGKK